MTTSSPISSTKKLWLSWKEAHARVVEVCGPVGVRHLKNIANKPGTFFAGQDKNGHKAPLPRLYPVDVESLELWLHGTPAKAKWEQ